MNDFNFLKWGDIDVSFYKNIFDDATSNEDWDNEFVEERRRVLGKTHHDMLIIPIMNSGRVSSSTHDDGHDLTDNFTPQPPTRFYKKYYNKNFFDKLSVIMGPGHIQTVKLSCLPSMCNIAAHIDTQWEIHSNRRLHIPIITHPDVAFNVGSETRFIDEGEVVEINNDKKIHSVHNLSNVDRIHMIVDWHSY